MEKILEIKNLKKKYEGKLVHKGINFYLLNGETLGLLGYSGSGKSVLLRSIIGLEDIDAGEVLYHNKRIDNLEEKELFNIRTKISYAFQSGALFDSISVFENIAYPLLEHTDLSEQQIEKKVLEILSLIGLSEARDLMPSDLSGGMQKRAGLARSIALNPEILLYDEPTAGLDPVNVDLIIDVIKTFKSKGIASIFVTHDIPAAKKVCDRVLLIKEGEIYFVGTIPEFEMSQDSYIRSFSMGTMKEKL
jgi:phospholipid/cholesterol/gamma-HCH transport system ATP-binding protein